MSADRGSELLTPAEVAALFRVDAKTVTRWANIGKLSSVRTLGGHRRYRADEVRSLLKESEQVIYLDEPSEPRLPSQGARTDQES
jgi:excisionase family DNA binding protein